MALRVLGIIPARGGSKGVPRKNIKMLAGRPLLAYTAEAALAAKRLTKVILSTEDNEIAAVGRELGLDVPFMRPAELAADDTPTFPVVVHALDEMKKLGDEFDAVCLLQPTNPLRLSEDIDACINLLESSDADSVVSVLPVPVEYNPHWVYLEGSNGELKLATGEDQPIARRQELPKAFHRDGCVYVTHTAAIFENASLYGRVIAAYHSEAKRSVNIDSMSDWFEAERLVIESSRLAEPHASISSV
jgi:CMP-N,N'-diacetyllegionaminic acid synthase